MADFIEQSGVKIPLVFEQNDDFGVVIAKLIFKNCGRSFDKVAGAASLFARILNEGVNDKFFKELDFYAINLSASSGFESLEISLSMLKENAKFAFKKLGLLLKNPRFEDEILKRVKNNALGELASKNSDFDYLAKVLLNKTAFKTHEFDSSNDGNSDSLKKISLLSLKQFYDEFINLNNLCISIGGQLSLEEVKELLKEPLNALKIGKASGDKHYELSKDLKDEILIKEQSKQAYIYFCSPFFAGVNDAQNYLAKTALFVLGQGGFGSRIMEEVRVKRGLAYSAYAMLDIRKSYSRVFGYLQTKNENAKSAKSLVRELFEDFVKNGVKKDELEQAKKFLIGSAPLRYESLSKRLNIALDELYLGLDLGHYKKELKKIESIKLGELNEYIKAHKEVLNLCFASVQNEA